MKREEEIINAATEARMASAETLTPRGTHISIDDVPFVDKIITYDEVAENAFIKGAQWADTHPKSPWISVKDDLPCNHEELWAITGKLMYTKNVLVSLTNNTIRLVTMLYDDVNDKWKWDSPSIKDKIVYWMPIPNLPKE